MALQRVGDREVPGLGLELRPGRPPRRGSRRAPRAARRGRGGRSPRAPRRSPRARTASASRCVCSRSQGQPSGRPQRGHDVDEAGELVGGGWIRTSMASRHDRMSGDVRSTRRVRPEFHRVRPVAGQHGRDPLRRPARSRRPAERPSANLEGARADDRDPGAARAEDARQPDGRGAPGARAGALRAADALRRGQRRRQAASSSPDVGRALARSRCSAPARRTACR